MRKMGQNYTISGNKSFVKKVLMNVAFDISYSVGEDVEKETSSSRQNIIRAKMT